MDTSTGVQTDTDESFATRVPVSQSESELRNYLLSMARMHEQHHNGRPYFFRYHGYEHYVLERGRFYESMPRPKKYRRGTPRYCFNNALSLVIKHPELTYVEGYASGAVIPVQHAWVVGPDGKAMEITWEEPGDSYYGVEFSREDLIRVIAHTKLAGIMPGDYRFGFPLLKGLPPGTQVQP